MIELQCPAVLDTLVEGRHRTSQHARPDPESAMGSEELEVDASTRSELTRTLDQCAAGAEIDERDGVPWPQDRVRSGDLRLAEAPIDAPLG
jgi:hypothetical protein